MTIKFFIVVVVGLASVFGDPNSRAEATKSVLMEKARAELLKQFNEDEYQIFTTPRWIPNSVLEAGSENIKSVQLTGEIGRYANFEVSYIKFNRTQKAEIQVKLEVSQLLPVLNSKMRNGDVLSYESFDMRWVEIQLNRHKYISTIDELVGKTLRRSLNAGQPVKVTEVSNPLLIEAGDYVEMSFSNGGISIALTCEARESGTLGEEIAVFCPESRKNYHTKIIASGEAQWLRTY
ncbi:MAG: flagellar basal body P-ring formation chaperone FlgA [Balneolales bacterium]|nr:flagellar basal body P-ring formation chaperone FlgA [Balneolales bacterium]